MIAQDRITFDSGHFTGQPCIRGTRLTVRRVLEIAAPYPNGEERQGEFPELNEEDLKQTPHNAALQLPY